MGLLENTIVIEGRGAKANCANFEKEFAKEFDNGVYLPTRWHNFPIRGFKNAEMVDHFACGFIQSLIELVVMDTARNSKEILLRCQEN